MSHGTGYRLLDPRPIAAESPYTFFLPLPVERDRVAPGDQVKLMFEHVPPGAEWGVERMWVTVTEVAGQSLIGTLDNVPGEPTASLALGDRITFEHYHIIAIGWDDATSAPVVPERQIYWSRCLVDQCVLDGAEPVEFLYRDTPDFGEAGDDHPDSGWRLRGRMGDATDAEIAAREAAHVALGAVLNRDDSWLPLIDAPFGSAFMRDVETGRYEAVER